MNIKKLFLVRILSICIGFGWINGISYSQDKDIDWMTWEEVDEKFELEKKKILVFVYTPWCEACKKMKYLTFRDSAIRNYINTNFYPIYFNAESSEHIEVNGRTYRPKAKGRYNELAFEITLGRLLFPTLVFIDEDFKIIQPLSSYIGPEKLEPVLHYYAGDHYKKTPWRTFANWYEKYKEKSLNTTQVKGKN